MGKSTTPRKSATEHRVTVAALAHAARRSVSAHRVEPGVHSGSTHGPAGQIVVTGVAENDVRQALELLDAARELQRDVTNLHADALLTVMTAASIPALPEPNAVLAQRRSVLRRHLLTSGALSNKDIAERRGITESSARTFVARERDEHRLFTVSRVKLLGRIRGWEGWWSGSFGSGRGVGSCRCPHAVGSGCRSAGSRGLRLRGRGRCRSRSGRAVRI